ncbi:MAG: hypothetical protein J7L47_06815 [Candidatus Odinarchaeota archaeon]|nr:hypothetical protein [Candidatus Odinarchaeota archaeon]
MKKIDKEVLAIFGISIGFFAVIILPYLLFGFYFAQWYISIPDIVDITLYGLIIGLSFFLLYEEKLQAAPTWVRYIFIYLFILHFTGHGFHWAANALNETIINIGSGTPPSVSEYAYYLDEIVSHYIMYPTFLGMLFVLLLADIYVCQESKKSDENTEPHEITMNVRRMLIPSVVFGFSYMVSSAEAQLPYLAIFFAIAVIAVLSIKFKFKDGFSSGLSKSNFRVFLFISSIVILITAAIYWMLFPGFPEPSKIL